MARLCIRITKMDKNCFCAVHVNMVVFIYEAKTVN